MRRNPLGCNLSGLFLPNPPAGDKDLRGIRAATNQIPFPSVGSLGLFPARRSQNKLNGIWVLRQIKHEMSNFDQLREQYGTEA